MNFPPQTVATLMQQACSALEKDEQGEAEAYCRQILTLQADHPEALGILGYVLHGSGRFGEAAAVFHQLTALQPSDPDHWMNLGTARRCAGEPEQALAAYAEAAARGADSR